MKQLLDQYKNLLLLLMASLIVMASGTAPAQEKAKVFVVKSKDISSYNLAIKGFRHQCPADWNITEYDLKGTIKNAGKITQNINQVQPDLAVAVGAKALLALTRSKISCPIVFCMVMKPTAYDLQAFDITGISLTVSPEEQIAALSFLNPKIKKIAVLMRKHAASDLASDITRAAKKYKVEVVPVEFESEKDIPQKLRGTLNKVHALWMLDDAFIHSKETLRFVILNAIENDLPFMAISEAFVKEGALISLSPSYLDNGKQAAELAKDILTKNVKPKNIPVHLHGKPNLILNQKIARKIGLTIPPEMLGTAKKIYE